MPNSNFLLQTNPKVYKVYEALQKLPQGSNQIVLNDGSKKPWLQKGTRVYMWESGGRDLIARGTVIEARANREMPLWQQTHFPKGSPYQPLEPRAVIRVDMLFETPVSRAQLKKIPKIANAVFFRNDQNITGTVFNVEPAVADALDLFIGYTEVLIDELAKLEQTTVFDPGADDDTREWELRPIALRRGQPSFRRDLLKVYEKRCAITGSDAVECLEAAHILPYKNHDRNHITNGLLLRSDIHTLFDLHLLTVAAEGKIMLAPSLATTEYGLSIANLKLRLPQSPGSRPSEVALAKHRSLCEWAQEVLNQVGSTG